MAAKLRPVVHPSDRGSEPSPYWNHFRSKEHCRDCPEGAGLSVTVFFPGLGDDVVDGRFTYVPESQIVLDGFRHWLGRRIDPTAPRPAHEAAPVVPACCMQMLQTVEHDPYRSVIENAEDVAVELLAIVARAAGRIRLSWIREVCFHLVGFSAGGLVALDTAKIVSERLVAQHGRCAKPRPAGQTWCGRPAPPEVSVGIDVVTIASPYDGAPFVPEVFAELGLLFGFDESRFRDSVGAQDYGGGPRPACLRRFVALVTEKGADDAAGGQLPGDQVEGWGFETYDLPGVSHLLALTRVRQVEQIARLIDQGCGCSG